MTVGIFCPSLHFAPVEWCRDDDIAQGLLLQLLEFPRRRDEEIVVQGRMSDIMAFCLRRELEGTINERHAVNMARLSRKARAGLRLLRADGGLSEIPDKPAGVLAAMGSAIGKADGERNAVFLLNMRTSLGRDGARWASILEDGLPILPDAGLLQRLRAMDFGGFPGRLAPVVGALTARSTDRRVTGTLLVKTR